MTHTHTHTHRASYAQNHAAAHRGGLLMTKINSNLGQPKGWEASRSYPSGLWHRVHKKLRPYLTPGQYVRDARASGMSWNAIAEMLTEDTGIKIGCAGSTLEFWARVDHTDAAS